MSPIRVAMLALLVAVVKKAFELILEHEYASWAPRLARLLVGMAGLICRHRSSYWWADLMYEQQVWRRSGLMQAGWCLTSAPWLALRHFSSSLSLGRVLSMCPVVVAFFIPGALLEITRHVDPRVVVTTWLSMTVSGWAAAVIIDGHGIRNGAKLVCWAMDRSPRNGVRFLRSRAFPWVSPWIGMPLYAALGQILARVIPGTVSIAMSLDLSVMLCASVVVGVVAGLVIGLVFGMQGGATFTLIRLRAADAAQTGA